MLASGTQQITQGKGLRSVASEHGAGIHSTSKPIIIAINLFVSFWFNITPHSMVGLSDLNTRDQATQGWFYLGFFYYQVIIKLLSSYYQVSGAHSCKSTILFC